MPIITLTREHILGGPLDEERHVLLSCLADLDLAGQYEADKYIRPLINKRLQEIVEQRERLQSKESDPAGIAEAIKECESHGQEL